MTNIGNGIGQQMHTKRSLDELREDAASLGYEDVKVEPIVGTREFRAIGLNAKAQRAEALGYNEVAAVRSLVRTLRMK